MALLRSLTNLQPCDGYRHVASTKLVTESPLKLRNFTYSCVPTPIFETDPPKINHTLLSMANTYTQIYIQVVFAVQGRQNLITSQRKEELHKYITGIVTRQGQKLIAVHCMPDHTHVLIGLKPSIALSDLVGDIKTGSTNHINEN